MSNQDSIYAGYPAEYAQIAQGHEDHIREALAGTPALSLELPAALYQYQRAALALLRAVTITPSADIGATFATDYLHKRCAAEADTVAANAATRVERLERDAHTHYRELLVRQVKALPYIGQGVTE